MLNRKADVNAKSAEGHTPLWFAVASEEDPKGKVALLDLLTARGGDVQARFDEGKTLLHLAAGVGVQRVDIQLFADTIKWLVRQGVPAGAKAQKGRTAAFLAAKAKNCPIARLLVEVVPGLTRDELGVIATEAMEDMDWLQYLIEKRKANINARGEDGKTLLHRAAEKDSVELSRYLLDHGADPTIQDDHNSTWLEQSFTGDSVREHFRAAIPKP